MSRQKRAVSFVALILVFAIYADCCTACGADPTTSATLPISPAPTSNTNLQINTYPPLGSSRTAIRFVRYGIGDGLSQSSVQAIFQDNLGFLWVGTQDGLNRFDGYSFKTFRPDTHEPDTLSGRNISSIVQGKDGMIWVGTSSGLNRYDPATGTFIHLNHDSKNSDSLVDDAIKVLRIDSQGMLWVGTSHGLDEFDPAVKKFRHINALPITAIYEDHNKTLWVGTASGLFDLDVTRKSINSYRIGGNSSENATLEISSISGDEQNNIWVGTQDGLIRLGPTPEQFTKFNHSDLDPTSLVNDSILVTYMDRADELWIGTQSGLDRFDAQNSQFIHYQNDPVDPNSLSNNTVDAIYEDRGGILWIGTKDGGLDKYDHKQDQFQYYHHVNTDPQSLSGDIISPIAPLPNGKIWIGNDQKGLNLFDPATGEAQHFRHDPADPNTLLSDTITSLFLDKKQTLWIGTREGMDRLDPESSNFIHYVYDAKSPADSIPPGPIYTIFQDNQFNYWVGTSHGVRLFDPVSGRFSKLTITAGNIAALANDVVRVIFQDRNGSIWIGTDTQGLLRFNPTTRTLDQFKNDPKIANSITDAPIMDVYEDSHGNFWVATFGGGLNRYVPQKNNFMQYLQNNGLPNDVVYGILEDKNGFLWLSTDLGLSRFNPTTNHFDNFTVEDGLQSNEFDRSAFAKGSDGSLYFGGINGLTVFNPSNIRKNQYIPPVVLTSLDTVNGKPIDSAVPPETLQEVTLRYPQNSFDFSFAALSFSRADKNQYSYKLEGFDREWHVVGTNQRGSYTNLPGGSFTLHIIGSNSDGVWNQQGTAIKVVVIPPPWQTWPFRGLMAAAFLAAVLFIYQSRMRGIKSQKAELEKIVRDRTLALTRQNQGLEALYWADDKMLRVFTIEEVMQALVDVAVDILQADKSAVFVETVQSGKYQIRVSRGFSAGIVKSLHFADEDGIAMLATLGKENLVINDIANNAETQKQWFGFTEKMLAENVHSLMYMPIKVQNKVLGIFNVCSSQLNAFDEDHQRLFAFLVQRAALSIEISQLVQQTKQMAIRDERSRLAQELHDSAKQKTFAALAQLGAAKRLATSAGNNIAEHLTETESILRDVIRDMTFLIQELYPKTLKEQGLIPSLRNYAFEWENRFGIHLSLSVIDERSLPLEIEQVLYRVILEGLSNIARHSRATQADIHVIYQKHNITIKISDNGQGFDIQNTASGLGLHLIRERMESIDGQADIQSRPGAGTQLSIHASVDVKEQ